MSLFIHIYISNYSLTVDKQKHKLKKLCTFAWNPNNNSNEILFIIAWNPNNNSNEILFIINKLKDL